MPSSVSVVIPAFNAAAYLGQALDSVFAQTRQPAEVIVVDDDSKDETPEIVAPYAGRVTYIRKEGGGPACARNSGIRAASGEWIGFLDADDIWLPEFLQKLVHAGAESAADLVFSDHLMLVHGRVAGPALQERNGLKHRLQALAPDGILLNPFELLLEIGSFFATSAVLVRREALAEAGLFDETLRSCEDLDLWLRLALNGRFCPVAEALMHRRIHAENMSFDRRTMITSWAEVLDRVDGYARTLPEDRRPGNLPQKQKAAVLRSQGALYWDEGNLPAARERWAKGFRATRSPKFAAYLLASYFPRAWIQALLERKWRTLSTAGYKG